MFGRKKTMPTKVAMEQTRSLMLEQFDQRVAASRATRPAAYPDGTPFDVEPQLAALRDLALESIPAAYRRGEAGMDVLLPFLQGVMYTLAVVQELRSVEPTPASVDAIMGARLALKQLGLREERFTDLTQSVHKYWTQSGAMDRLLASQG